MKRRNFIKGVGVGTVAMPFVLRGAKPAKIKVGQIGLVHPHSRGKLGAIRSLEDEYDLIGVVEPDVNRQAGVKGVKFISEKELFNTKGLQVVAVETNVRDLVPTASRVLATRRHIHLDKPAGSSLLDFKKLVVVAKREKLR